VASYQVPSGEASKSLDAAARLYDWLVETGTERRDLVLALGGGVVGDLAGFAAATFLRGVRLVQIPTSLLAQVDSSVGGKVAVNHPRGKNLIGAFYPPSLVIVDSSTLSTLPARELSAALAEVVKMGVILDPQLFDLLEREAESLLRLEPAVVEQVVARSIELKAGVVQQDERESGPRAILNYGHTIGHGVEAASDYLLYRHGEAVAIGMEGAARLAAEIGSCPRDLAQRQGSLLRRFGLPLSYRGVAGDAILEAMSRDKKASRGRLTWVLPERIGKMAIRRDVPESAVERVVAELAG
jgi:3-dehydroquinate synthase